MFQITPFFLLDTFYKNYASITFLEKLIYLLHCYQFEETISRNLIKILRIICSRSKKFLLRVAEANMFEIDEQSKHSRTSKRLWKTTKAQIKALIWWHSWVRIWTRILMTLRQWLESSYSCQIFLRTVNNTHQSFVNWHISSSSPDDS